MPAPEFVRDILGLRVGVPNNADIASLTSRAIAAGILDHLRVDVERPRGFDAGTALEVGVRNYLAAQLAAADPLRAWDVDRRKLITDFQQYEHLARLDALVLE